MSTRGVCGGRGFALRFVMKMNMMKNIMMMMMSMTTFFIFILVYFSAHDFRIVNSLRQLRHDAGGFSYKSMRTLRELFPLINFGCKCCHIAHTKNIYERYGFEFENLAHKKGYSVYHSDITATKKN